MPQRDTEAAGNDYQNSGTSMAAPQVCGAATLYRSLRPEADALETKAAILATTESVAAQNIGAESFGPLDTDGFGSHLSLRLHHPRPTQGGARPGARLYVLLRVGVAR